MLPQSGYYRTLLSLSVISQSSNYRSLLNSAFLQPLPSRNVPYRTQYLAQGKLKRTASELGMSPLASKFGIRLILLVWKEGCSNNKEQFACAMPGPLRDVLGFALDT